MLKTNGAVVYVGSSLTVHNPLIFCSPIVTIDVSIGQ